MSPKHRYQVMPDLSLEERAALKADIAANGVRIPIEVDEEGNIIDGFQPEANLRRTGHRVSGTRAHRVN